MIYSPAGQGGGYIITGGKDGKVKFHDPFMRHLFEVCCLKQYDKARLRMRAGI
jgi:hypothetical protein